MNSVRALFGEDQMSDEEEAEEGDEFISDDELSDDEDEKTLIDDIFGKEPKTKEQFLEELRKKKAEENKAAYVTPEKKFRQVGSRKGLLVASRFLKNGPSSSQKPKAASTPNPAEIKADGGLTATS